METSCESTHGELISGHDSKEGLTLKLSRNVKITLISIKIAGLVIPHTLFILYVVYLARYQLDHWYYFPFAAQFWWGIICLFLLAVVELLVMAEIVKRSVNGGASKWVPKSEATCSRCRIN